MARGRARSLLVGLLALTGPIGACRTGRPADRSDLPASPTMDDRVDGGAMAALVRLLPAGVDAFAAIDVASLREEGLIALFLGPGSQGEPAAVAGARAALGIDPFEDVDRVVVGLDEKSSSGASLVAIVRCRYQPAPVIAAATKAGVALLGSEPAAGEGGGKAIALVTSDTLVVGDRGLVAATVEHIAGRAIGALDDPVLAHLWRVASSNRPVAALAARVTPSLSARIASAGFSKELSTLLAALAVDGDGSLRGALLLAPASATSLEDEAIAVRAALARAGENRLLDLLGLGASLRLAMVSVRAPEVRVDYHLPASSLRRAAAIVLLLARAGGHPAAARGGT